MNKLVNTYVNEVKQLEDFNISLEKASCSKMYGEKFREAGINKSTVKHLKEIEHFPFTDKEDLKHFSFRERLTVPEHEVLRIHTSSGTSGKPVAFGYTRNDLKEWTVNLTNVLLAMGFNRNDRVLFPAPLGLPTGLGYLSAFENVGAALLPTGPGRTGGIQIPALRGEFGIKPNSLCCLPSYLFRISETALKEGIEPQSLGIRKIQTGGEAFSPEVQKKAELVYGARLFEGYGLAEAWGGPSIASSVVDTDDLTVWEDCFLVEVINPITLQNMNPGEEGELVITSLKKDANPVIRYRTGDLTRLISDSAGKYRPFKKIAKIRSRLDDMVKVKGVKLYPTDFESVFTSFEPWNGEFEVIIQEKEGKEEISVNIESQLLSDSLQDEIQKELKEKLNITCSVRLLPHDAIHRPPGKAKRIQDKRISSIHSLGGEHSLN